jgi:hypothetical protein
LSLILARRFVPSLVDYVFDPTFCSVDAPFLLELVVIGEVAQSLLALALTSSVLPMASP